jgi:uncharacterized repeat protein (TIGR01451 family)
MKAFQPGAPRGPRTVLWRRLTVYVAAAAALVVLAGVALADSPDIKVPPNQSPLVTATAVQNANGTVTVTVKGAWAWPTHGNDCNLNRAGIGVAVDWFDSKNPGFDLGASAPINGVSTPIKVGATLAVNGNAVDNIVHPTENDTGSGAVANVADPSQFASWRGGCGVFSATKNISGASEVMSHGNLGNVQPGQTDGAGHPFNDPNPPAGAAQQGALLQHTYASASDLSKLCVITYDVHGTSAQTQHNGVYTGTGVGVPNKAGEVTAGGSGHNGDNSVEKNQNTPLGNACVAATITPPPPPPPPPNAHPAISIVKDPSSQTIASGGTATFKITVTNTGDVTLTNVTVGDTLSPNCNRNVGTLAAGASITYTCTKSNVTAGFTNVAIATGHSGSTTVTAQDTAPVKVTTAALKPKTVKKVSPKVVSHRKPKATG